MELREPQKNISKILKIDFPRKRRRKADLQKPKPRGTVTGHYMSFLSKAMNEMDRFPEMKGYYIVMDNTPIYTSQEISAMVADRGYRSVYLPPYSPELNPIEKFWAIVRNKVKRSQFNDTEDLITRISEACNSVPPKHLRAFVQHSVNVFEKCLNGEAI